MDASPTTATPATVETSATEQLLAWWKDIPSNRKKYERLSPRGAVASKLAFYRGDLAAVRAAFGSDAERLSARYPAFWRDVQAILGELEHQAEAQVVNRIVAELG